MIKNTSSPEAAENSQTQHILPVVDATTGVLHELEMVASPSLVDEGTTLIVFDLTSSMVRQLS